HPHCNTRPLSSRFDPLTTAVVTVGDQFSVEGEGLVSPRRSTGVARRWPQNQTLGCHHSWLVCPSRTLAFRSLKYCPTWLVLPHLALHWSLDCHRSWPAFLSRTLAFRSLKYCPSWLVLLHLALHWSLDCRRSLPACPSRMLAFRSLSYFGRSPCLPRLAFHWPWGCVRFSQVGP